MKKILLVILTFLSVQNFAQDKEYFEKIKNLKTTEAAVEVGWDIVKLMREKFVLKKPDTDDERGLSLMFLKASAIDSLRKAGVQNMSFKPDEYVVVNFTRETRGANPDLEIKGTTVYNFHSVTYKYLDLFPFWQKYFRPDATKESVLTDVKYQNSEIQEKGIWWLYKFEKEKDEWTIRKFY